MKKEIPAGQLADEIRYIYKSDPKQAETLIETYLDQRLYQFATVERLAMLGRLAAEFPEAEVEPAGAEKIDEEVLTRLFSLVLGGKVSKAELSSTELLRRLAESLNTIFDTLNQLVSVINKTLLGEPTGDDTIRQYIGFHLEGETQSKSLETYLGQISKAFLIVQEGFKTAAFNIVREILLELDPGQIAKDGGGGLKFGPLRRAGFFDIYEKKYERCRRWFESGRFMEEFLREFEKNCQKMEVAK